MDARTILLVDDDPKFRAQVRNSLGGPYQLVEASNEIEFWEVFRPGKYGLVILDMRLRTNREGLDLLREIYRCDDQQPVIVVSAYGDTETTINAVESGAIMFLHKKEFTPTLLARMVEAVLHQARIQRRLAALEIPERGEQAQPFVGSSPGVVEALRRARDAAADTESRVLLLGETGSGRTLAARTIYEQTARRREGAFIRITEAVTRVDTWQASLFGDRFQVGTPRRKGLLEQANGGLVFFSNLASFPSPVILEVVLVLANHRLPLGCGADTIPFTAQLAASCDARTGHETRKLFGSQLSGARLIDIVIPPLRERPEDISLLASHFLQQLRYRAHSSVSSVSRRALEIFERYEWPANVLELRNTVEFAAIRATAEGDDEIEVRHLPHHLVRDLPGFGSNNKGLNYRYCIARAEVDLIERALCDRHSDSKTQLAAMLGYRDRFTFQRRLLRNLQAFPRLAGDYPMAARFVRSLRGPQESSKRQADDATAGANSGA
jgi:DNA-binding NtrC family response regulator